MATHPANFALMREDLPTRFAESAATLRAMSQAEGITAERKLALQEKAAGVEMVSKRQLERFLAAENERTLAVIAAFAIAEAEVRSDDFKRGVKLAVNYVFEYMV